MKYDPEHGADHLSAYDLERMMDPPTPLPLGPVCDPGMHLIVKIRVCRLCGEALGLEEPV